VPESRSSTRYSNLTGSILSFKVLGKGRGGNFSFGRYVRQDRFLELHYRYTLGLVTYHIGNDSLDHETYMRFLGVYGNNSYPDFPQNPIDSFHNLAKDLERHCIDFLRGDGGQFRKFAAEWKSDPKNLRDCPD
jgi:hypothetical protein